MWMAVCNAYFACSCRGGAGKNITTIEGLDSDESRAVQQAWVSTASASVGGYAVRSSAVGFCVIDTKMPD